LDVVGRACLIKDKSKYTEDELAFAEQLSASRAKAEANINNMVSQAENKADNMKQIITDMQSMAQKIQEAKGNGSGKVLKHLFNNKDAVLNTLDAIANYSYSN
jgi:citrate synthase